jgi:hypothetical protein
MFDSHTLRIVATADQDIFIYITVGPQASISFNKNFEKGRMGLLGFDCKP